MGSEARSIASEGSIKKKDTQNSMEIKNDIFDVHESNGKGLGAFAANKILEGTEIVTEKPSVIGPKKTSSFVCVECFDYIDEQTVNPCRMCGFPLCLDCKKLGSPKYHVAE